MRSLWRITMAKKEKNLKHLLYNMRYDVLKGTIDNISINKLCYNTNLVEENDIFVCIKGENYNSHDQIKYLINKKVKVIVVSESEKEKYENLINENIDIILIRVANTRKALCLLSKNYFDNASDKLKIIGITGTKGKTTTSFMIKKILESGTHKKVGLIGSIGCFIGDDFYETDNTTPESFIIHEFFYKMVNAGIEYVVMEVSSQSLKYNRIDGINFYYVLWTNIFADHIGKGEHTDYNDYLESKLKIFSMAKNAIINAETKDIEYVINKIDENRVNKLYLSIKKINNKSIKIFNPIDNIKLFNDEKNLGVEFDYLNNSIKLNFPGMHNVENAMLAITFGLLNNISIDDIKTALNKLNVAGRSEVVFKNKDFLVIVDYAHNGIGTKALLNTINEYKFKRVIVVFGCGGNRSRDRRYDMGKTVSSMADFAYITSDNSRFEKAEDIIKDILSAYKSKKYKVIVDRKEAIDYAIKNHKRGDCILIIGKGHETYNDVMGKKTHFSDKEEAIKTIKKYKYGK